MSLSGYSGSVIMLSNSRVRSWSWIVVPILATLAAACVEEQPTEPTITGIMLAKGGGGGEPAVDGTQPPGAPQGKTLDVQVFGSSFDQGSNAAFTIDGHPGRVHTNSTHFVSRSELVSNITIDLDADITLYDVEVTTSKGKKGVGADLFSVVAEGTEVYTTIYLRSLTGKGKGSQSTNGSAHDITEPDANGLLRVVGGSEEWRTGGTQPVVWTGTLNTIADADPEALALRGYAAGINDDGTVIAGRVKHTSGGPTTPAAWLGPDWTLIDLQLLEGFIDGNARDVNNDGLIVGSTKNGVDTLATRWASPTAVPSLLPTPTGFRSKAMGLNNQGYVVGWIWDPATESSTQAVLWRPDGSWCNLQPDGQQESLVHRVDDVVDGTVLVAGRALPADQPAIWTVNVADCSFAYEPVATGAGSSVVDVRRVPGGWEAVGTDHSTPTAHAALWTSGGTGQELDSGASLALVVNNAGHVVGVRAYQGVDRAVLWVK